MPFTAAQLTDESMVPDMYSVARRCVHSQGTNHACKSDPVRSVGGGVVKLLLSDWGVSQVVMPVSLEQWRSSVGSNNAARSHVIEKHLGKKSPKNLFGQYLQFLLALFFLGITNNKGGKTKTALLHRCM